MKYRTITQIDDALADMVWWIKGFCAARPPAIDEGDGAHLTLRDQLSEVRRWLGKVERGEVRRLGDETAIVLKFGEFEQIYDALAHPNGTIEDRLAARAVVKAILAEYQREDQSARNPDAPF